MLNGAEAHPIQSATRALFDRYEREFNAGLTGEADLEAVAALYAACFIAASPAGVFTGMNDDELRSVSAKGFKHYRDTGVQRMTVRNLDISAIDELHGLARVAWRAIYKVDGAQSHPRRTQPQAPPPAPLLHTFSIRPPNSEEVVAPSDRTQSTTVGWLTCRAP
ncbi:hypothetical protein GmRootV118_27450 [Variovorax sp. V118]|uniref:hypothetical protein n=1 Tax=Variovorax sp. V118 TaxID=3065954 RepID=UPI0034E8A126